jgi:hypothetical protein
MDRIVARASLKQLAAHIMTGIADNDAASGLAKCDYLVLHYTAPTAAIFPHLVLAVAESHDTTRVSHPLAAYQVNLYDVVATLYRAQSVCVVYRDAPYYILLGCVATSVVILLTEWATDTAAMGCSVVIIAALFSYMCRA